MKLLNTILLNILRAIVGIGATGMVFIAVMIAIDFQSLRFAAILVMLAIALCFTIKRGWGFIRIALCVMAAAFYCIAVEITVFCMPLFTILYGLVPVIAVTAMLKGTNRKMRLSVTIIFLIAAIYCWFVNDIMEPMDFSIRDSVVNTPALWNNSYLFYWITTYLCSVAWTACVPSTVLLLAFHLYRFSSQMHKKEH